jgi:hypothetical protein
LQFYAFAEMSDLIRVGEYEKLVVLVLEFAAVSETDVQRRGCAFHKAAAEGVSAALQEGQRNLERTEHHSLQATRDLSRLY